MSNWVPPIDSIAINEETRTPPYIGSEVNPAPSAYIEDGMVPVPGAPTPDRLWLLADYDPLFYVGLMAKYGYTHHAWKAIKDDPPPIKPYIPPRPIPSYIGFQTGVGDFSSGSAPEFTV